MKKIRQLMFIMLLSIITWSFMNGNDSYAANVPTVDKPVYLDEDDGTQKQILWHNVPGISGYELRVTNSKGEEYAYHSKYVSEGKYVPQYLYASPNSNNITYSSYYVSHLFDYIRKFSETDGFIDNDYIESGVYSVYVRAYINEYSGDKVVNTLYGDWSQPVKVYYKNEAVKATPTPSKKALKFSGIKYNSEKGQFDLLLSGYPKDSEDRHLPYCLQISDTKDFEYNVIINMSDNDNNRHYVSKFYLEEFQGKTLFFRVYDDASHDTDTKNAVYSNVIKYKVPVFNKVKAAPKIKKLFLDKVSYTNDLCVKFDASIENGCKYYIEVSTTPDFSSDVKTYSNTNRIPYSTFSWDREYYIRVQTSRTCPNQYVWSEYNESLKDFQNRTADIRQSHTYVSKFYSFSKFKYFYYYDEVYSDYSKTLKYKRSLKPSKIKDFSLVEKAPHEFVFKCDASQFSSNEAVQLEISPNKDFKPSFDKTARIYFPTYTTIYASSFQNDPFYSINLGMSYMPGTYYVRARRTISENSATGEDKSTYEGFYFGDWSEPVKISIPKFSAPTYYYIESSATAGAILLYNEYTGSYKGYEVEKKSGSSWKPIYKGPSSIVPVSGLSLNSNNTYRARMYKYNQDTKKYTYGEWADINIYPWATNLDLKAELRGNKQVVLSWKSVAGAAGYEIYRVDSNAEKFYETSQSVYYESTYFESNKLIKTLSAGAHSFTDNDGKGGAYIVRAYRYVNGKKVVYQEVEECYTNTLSINNFKTKTNSNGTVNASWNHVPGVKKYIIEKYNPKTRSYKAYKTVKSPKVTLPKCASTFDSDEDRYRISAYNGKKFIGYHYFSVYLRLSAPTNVKATLMSDGAVKITWKPVKGADYYYVYKTKSLYAPKTGSVGGYVNVAGNASTVVTYVKDKYTKSGYREVSKDELTDCAYDLDGEEGGTYYYFVATGKYIPNKYVDVNEKYTGLYGTNSNLVKVTNLVNTVCEAPTVKSLKESKNKAVLTWKKMNIASGYEIYRSTSKSSGYKKIKTISKNSTVTFTDSIKKNKTYYYKIRAIVPNKYGEKTYSQYSDIREIEIASTKSSSKKSSSKKTGSKKK